MTAVTCLRALTLIAAVGALGACMPMTTTTGNTPAETPRPADTGIAGRYAINGVNTDLVVIRRLEGNRYAVENPGNWEGVGVFDGRIYYGVFRYPERTQHGSLAKVVGIHRAERQRNGSFKVHGSFGASSDGHQLGEFDVTWEKL